MMKHDFLLICLAVSLQNTMIRLWNQSLPLSPLVKKSTFYFCKMIQSFTQMKGHRSNGSKILNSHLSRREMVMPSTLLIGSVSPQDKVHSHLSELQPKQNCLRQY